ncbi:MAG TPA: right-handed parallel beta-helix repeat-containing protein, partial [Phycisphaerales bacterium]|nr:right-handed parallel beta-helix repeat-containing protein [Phycisphaerales bacterium]
SGGMGITVRGVKDLNISGNTIEGYYLYKVHKQTKPLPDDISGIGYGIVLDSITNLTLQNNTISQPGPFAKGDVFKVRIK